MDSSDSAVPQLGITNSGPVEQPSGEVSPPPQTAEVPNAVNVLNPEGELVSIPSDSLDQALQTGYRQPSSEEVNAQANAQKYGTPGQQLATGLEGAASAATFGLSTGLERMAGVPGEDIRGRREENPWVHGLAQIPGLAVSALIPGAGEANILKAAGEGVSGALGLGGAGLASKIGSEAVKMATGNMMFQGGDEISKMLSGDPTYQGSPSDAAETAVLNVGLAGLIGGGLGGAFGAVSPLWQAAKGSQTGRLLRAISEHLGGIDGAVSSDVTQAVSDSGIEVAPEVKSAMSGDPMLKQMASTLEQSDTTASGQRFQQAVQTFRKDASENLAAALGRSPEDVEALSDMSKAEHGKAIGETLAKEYSDQVDPIAKQYEGLKNKYSKVDLAQPSVAEDGTTKPSTVGNISDRIAKLAIDQGWTASPSSPEMKAVSTVLEELPLQKTVGDLENYAQRIGNNTAREGFVSTPLERAGMMMKNIVREAQSDIIGDKIGAEEGVEALGQYNQARQQFAKQAQVKEALDSSLGAKGSVSGYAKSIRAMAKMDPETLLRRMSGEGDSALIKLMQEKFPQTMQKVSGYHIDNLLKSAAAKAQGQSILSPEKLFAGMGKMSPELRAAVVPPDAVTKIKAVQTLIQRMGDNTHNWSNTARTADKLFEKVPGSALGLATILTGHSPTAGWLVSKLTKALSKDAPDAVRLGLLKFLGSNNAVDAGGFKTAVDFIHNVAKGQALFTSAAKNVFRAGAEVLPQSQIPTESDRARLNKALKNLQGNPKEVLNVGGKTGHYLPDHGQALTQTAASVAQYLNSNRPGSAKQSPLDSSVPISSTDKARYENMLNIAQQPLIVLGKVKAGNVTPEDVAHLQAMFPSTYSRLVQEMTNHVMDASAKGTSIPYPTRMGLSVLLAKPLDSTMTPQGIMGAQPIPRQSNQPNTSPSAAKTKELNKMPSMLQTPGQAREAQKQKPE